MKMSWNELSKLNINNKDKFVNIFRKVLDKINEGVFNFKESKIEKNDYYIIVEEDRLNSYFVHIVPKEAYSLFNKMKIEQPSSILGFSVLVGKYNNREVRVSCFSIPCDLLSKAIIGESQK